MPKKKSSSAKKQQQKPDLVSKLIKFPADWVERVDEARGDVSFSDFVREAVLAKIDRRGLSEMPAWGQGRPRKDA